MIRVAAVLAMAVVLPAASTMRDVRPPRALWVWDTAPILGDATEREKFFEFCERHRIVAAAIYIRTADTKAGTRLSDATEWHTLLAAAHRHGIRVHALDGAPEYALRAHHQRALSVVDAVIAYNVSAGADARFHGVHFDIEPYLLTEWKEPGAPHRIFEEYLELAGLAAARAHAAKLVFGVDVPFWWQKIGDNSERLLEIVDNVAVMAYRNVASGADGIGVLGLSTIEQADTVGKARVVIGVETGHPSPGVPARTTFHGRSLADIETELGIAEGFFLGHPSYLGTAIHRYVTYRELAH